MSRAVASANEASMILPDVGSVSFMGYTGRELLMAGLVVCALGALFGLVMFVKLRNLPVHQSMRDVSELIYADVQDLPRHPGQVHPAAWSCSSAR